MGGRVGVGWGGGIGVGWIGAIGFGCGGRVGLGVGSGGVGAFGVEELDSVLDLLMWGLVHQRLLGLLLDLPV